MKWAAVILVLVVPVWLALRAGSAAQQSKVTESKVQFVEVSHQAGIDSFHDVTGGPQKDYIPEAKGGGVAVFDYNGDGWPDIFLVSGATFEELENSKAPHPHRNKLFRNNKDGTFTDVTEAAGLTSWGWGMAAAAADYDNDGCIDLYVTYYGQNKLYHNNCNGTFTDVTAKAGVAAGGWSAGAAWGDYDRDGHLDLYVARYIDFHRKDVPTKGSTPYCQYGGAPVFCGPRGLKPMAGILYHNNGDGTFKDVTEKALGPQVARTYGFTPIWADVDNDGWPDLFVASDSTPSLLYHNRKDGTFEEIAAPAGCAYSGDGLEQAGMGADFGDYNHDGWLDLFVGHFADDYNTLYRNMGDGTFKDVTEEAQILWVSWPVLTWATRFIDYDLDGWPDLFIVNGHVYPEADKWHMDAGYKQHPQVLQNQRNGTFKDVTALLGSDLLRKDLGRGAAFGDLDNDGDIDVVINNLDGTPWLLRCDSPPDAQWILVRLVGTRSNRDGLGARIIVRAGGLEQMQEVHQSGGFCSSSDPRADFGLGPSLVVDELEVRWPSGLVQKFAKVKSRQIVTIKEGDSDLHTEPVHAARSDN
jgi:hypothetical protein